eukprot:Pgem_evm1s20051
MNVQSPTNINTDKPRVVCSAKYPYIDLIIKQELKDRVDLVNILRFLLSLQVHFQFYIQPFTTWFNNRAESQNLKVHGSTQHSRYRVTSCSTSE